MSVFASDIAAFVESTLVGNDMEVCGVSTFNEPEANTIMFITKSGSMEDTSIRALYLVNDVKELPLEGVASYIRVRVPRLAFANVVEAFFTVKRDRIIAGTARIGRDVSIGSDVSIGEYCVIGDGVAIGDGVTINHHVVINDRSVIGAGTYVKSGSIIGEDGFGFAFDGDIPVRIPHLGRVIIGVNVEIGANCTIARGTIKDTVIGENVKMDDQVHIAHNCSIGSNTILTAQAEVSGSVEIGENCWIGPNASIINGIRIGAGSKVGIGSVVTEDLDRKRTVMCLNAIPLKKLIKIKRQLGLDEA
jgi:UDP-3-O-[3-hydroxymyristoyl] glucosamine N-acyltransferase